MRKVRTMHLGHLTISEDTQFYGVAAKGIMVAPGVHVEIHGMVSGDVTAGEGARVELYGMVSGAIRGDKSGVHVYGMMTGDVSSAEC